MTRSRSRIGKAWTEAMPAAIARGANDGQRSRGRARSGTTTGCPVR